MSSEQASEPTADRPQVLRMYAGALDDHMCAECAKHAGYEFHRNDPYAPPIPNPSCTSPHGCRCSWL